MSNNSKKFFIILVIPWLIIFSIFWLYPLIYSFILSFSKYKTLSGEIEFIGLSNYYRLFNDEEFYIALKNTFIFTFGTVPITTAISLILAFILNEMNSKLTNFFRSVYFLPSVTSLVVIALIFTGIYQKDGYLNMLLNLVGISGAEKGWLLEPNYALYSIMTMEIWISTGYYLVLFLSGLQTMPKEQIESAKLMGASYSKILFNIVLPFLKPTILFVIVINTIKSFQIFVEIYVMTKGGPLNSTITLVYQIYNRGFNDLNMIGYSSSIAYILFVLLIIISFFQFKLLKK